MENKFHKYIALYAKYHYDEYYSYYKITKEFFETVLKNHKENIYDILTYCMNFDVTHVEFDTNELEKIIDKYNLFEETYYFKDNIKEKYFETLLKKNSKFKIKITPRLFNFYCNLDNIKWIYDNYDKDEFDRCIRQQDHMSSWIVCWYAARSFASERPSPQKRYAARSFASERPSPQKRYAARSFASERPSPQERYAQTSNNISFIFRHSYFQHIEPEEMKNLLDKLNYKLSITEIKGLCAREELFEYLLTVFIEKDDALALFKGTVNIYLDSDYKKNLLYNMIKDNNDILEKNECILSLFSSKIDNFPIINLFLKKKILCPSFYIFELLKNFPKYSRTFKVLESIVSHNEQNIIVELAYFCFYNNFKEAFNFILQKYSNINIKELVDSGVIDQLYSGNMKVHVQVNVENYIFDLIDDVEQCSVRKHPNKKKMLHILTK